MTGRWRVTRWRTIWRVPPARVATPAVERAMPAPPEDCADAAAPDALVPAPREVGVVGLGPTFGIGMAGKRASGRVSSGIGAATAGGLAIERIVSVITLP